MNCQEGSMKVKHKMSSYHTLVLHMAMTGNLNDLKPKQSHNTDRFENQE